MWDLLFTQRMCLNVNTSSVRKSALSGMRPAPRSQRRQVIQGYVDDPTMPQPLTSTRVVWAASGNLNRFPLDPLKILG